MKEIDPNLPVNKEAYEIVSKSDEKGHEFKSAGLSSMKPLPTIPFFGYKSHDMTGIKKGRLVVIGYSASFLRKSKTGGTRWVVKCICGRYEIRKTRSLKNLNNKNDRCVDCRKVSYLKNGHHEL